MATRLVRIQELAGVLSTSPRTIRRLVAEGTIPVVRIGPRCIRFDVEAVLEAFAEQPQQRRSGRVSVADRLAQGA